MLYVCCRICKLYYISYIIYHRLDFICDVYCVVLLHITCTIHMSCYTLYILYVYNNCLIRYTNCIYIYILCYVHVRIYILKIYRLQNKRSYISDVIYVIYTILYKCITYLIQVMYHKASMVYIHPYAFTHHITVNICYISYYVYDA